MSRRSGRVVAAALALVALTLVTGCVVRPWSKTPFVAPADVAHIKLEGRDSALLMVHKHWLERKNGTLVVKGYVMPRLETKDTLHSRVVITLRDAAGAELKSIPVDFAPRPIPRRIRLPLAVGTFVCPLDPLPTNTATIVIAVRDDRPDA
jgi:hypothetical protein